MPYREIMIIFGILTGLIVLNKINSYFPEAVREKAKHVIIGLSVLILFNIINIIFVTVDFRPVSILSEIFFINLIYLSGSLFGVFLMINGFSEWIPAINKNNKFEQIHLARLELFKKAEHYSKSEKRFSDFAEKILSEIVTLYNYNHIELIAYSMKSGSLNSIARVGLEHKDYKINSVSVDDTLYNLFGECHLTFHGISIQPDIVLPLIINKKPVAFMCLWKNLDESYTNEDLKDITSIKILLENHLNDAVSKEFRQVLNAGELSSNLQLQQIRGNTIEEKMLSIYNYVKTLLPLDYMSLIIKKVNTNFHRYSVSESGYVLKEVNADFFTVYSVSSYCYKNNIPIVIDDLGKETDFIIETQIMKNDMCSMAVFPLNDNDTILGVITFASKYESAYKGKSRLILENNLPYFKNIVFDQQYHNDIAEQLERLNKIEKFALTADGKNESECIIKRAIDLLAEEIHPSMIRYSEYFDEEPFLYSHTLNTIIPYDKMMPCDGIMIKSLMPNHQIVIDQKKTLHVSLNKNDNIPESEAVQIFGRIVSSMVIVPVIHAGKLYGLISMAELRNHVRYAFTFSDIKLAESIARILSLGLSRYEQQRKKDVDSKDLFQLEMERKIRHSLTGICNSVEILRQNENKDPRTLKACVSILDSSMNDIDESLKRFTEI